MNVSRTLIALFTLIPLMEMILLVYLGNLLGFWPTSALVLVTGLLGAYLAHLEGRRVFHDWNRALLHGQIPEHGVISGLMVLVGGVLLITPGVLTDLVGFTLLLPWSRKRIARVLHRFIEQRGILPNFGPFGFAGDTAFPSETVFRSAPFPQRDYAVAPDDASASAGSKAPIRAEIWRADTVASLHRAETEHFNGAYRPRSSSNASKRYRTVASEIDIIETEGHVVETRLKPAAPEQEE
ncbi:MAG: FxsA family protein [Myxococcota bacterium]